MINLPVIFPSKKKKDLVKVIPVGGFENNKVVFKDGRIGVGFRVHSAEMESWNAGDFAAFNQTLSQQLSILPEKTTIQKSDIYYYRNYEGNQQAHEYFEMKVNRHFMHRLVLYHESYLFLTFHPLNRQKDYGITPLTTLLLATKDMLSNVFDRIENNLFLAEQKASEFVNRLQGFKHVSFTRLKQEDLKTLYSRYFTLDFTREDQDGIYCSLSADEDGVMIGNQRLNVISMSARGSYIEDAVQDDFGVAAPYTYGLSHYLQQPHITTTTIRIEDTDKTLKQLDSKRFWNGSIDFTKSQDREGVSGKIEEFTKDVRDNGNQLISVNVNLMTFESDPAIRQHYVEGAMSAVRDVANAKSILETTDTLALYMANCPGNAYNNYRWMLMNDEMGTKYFNLMSNFLKGNKGDLLCDRFQNPLRVDFFNQNRANQNTVLIGETGGGKSFTAGFLMIQRKERKARQVIIDVGGTYRNTLQMLNGRDFEQTYFEYDPENPLQFAPFLTERDAHGKYLCDIDKIDFLKSLLFTIWRGIAAAKEVKAVEKSIMQDIIVSYYEHISTYDLKAKFDTFYEFVEQLRNEAKENPESELAEDFEFFDVREFLKVLRPYYKGPLKQLLNGESLTDISHFDLQCFDLAKIKGKDMVYPVVTLLIIQLVLDQLAKYPDDEKYLYIDEAWSMLEGALGEFMEYMYRTIRKQKGCVWIMTQSVKDILKSPHCDAIMDNAATKIVLRHTDPKVVDKISSALGFTTHWRDLFMSLRKLETCREILVKMEDEVKVYALEAPHHHATVLSSKADERNEFVRLVNQYSSQAAAIEEFVQRKNSAA